jgi:hypothetical protein
MPLRELINGQFTGQQMYQAQYDAALKRGQYKDMYYGNQLAGIAVSANQAQPFERELQDCRARRKAAILRVNQMMRDE